MNKPPFSHIYRRQVLIVSPDLILSEQLARMFSSRGARPEVAVTVQAVSKNLEKKSPALVLVDSAFGLEAGLSVVERFRARALETVVIVLADSENLEAARIVMQRGAHGFLRKPISEEILFQRVGGVLKPPKGLPLRAETPPVEILRGGETWIASTSLPMTALSERLARVAAYGTGPVLISGETGSGKSVTAQMLHDLSPRAAEPYLCVHCASEDDSSFAGELFGFKSDAFGGAHERHRGLLERVGSGTLVLDEVSELPARLQSLLVRVLETGEFFPVGGSEPFVFQGRLVATTNRNLPLLVQEGKFREDLYFRLNALTLRIPSLRERGGDVEALAVHFCKNTAAALGVEASLSGEGLKALFDRSWPGNVRELRNTIERSVVACGGGTLCKTDLCLDEIRSCEPGSAAEERTDRMTVPRRTAGALGEYFAIPRPAAREETATLAQMEADHIQRMLDACGGNRSRAARVLGIARSTLLRKVESYGLETADDDESSEETAAEESEDPKTSE